MTNKNQPKIPLNGEIERPSHRSLGQCLTRSALLFSKTLHPEVIDQWKAFLEDCSPQAIEYAFETYNRNGRFFPKPKEILELIGAFKLSNVRKFTACGECVDGWLKVFDGKTAEGHPADKKTGAVRRCECWQDYLRGAA